MSSDRLTRKDIKQHDPFVQSVEKGVEYVQVNRKLIFGVLGGLVALAAFVFGVAAWLDSRGAEANRLLARGIQLWQAPIAPTAPKPDDAAAPSFATESARQAAAKKVFDELHDRFGGSEAADAASLYLAQIALGEGRRGDARQLWQDYLDEHAGSITAAGVRLSLFALDRGEGKAAEVEKEIRRLLETPEKELPDDALLAQLATTQEALGRESDAKLTWQRLVDEYPESTYAGEARQKSGAVGGGPMMNLGGA